MALVVSLMPDRVSDKLFKALSPRILHQVRGKTPQGKDESLDIFYQDVIASDQHFLFRLDYLENGPWLR